MTKEDMKQISDLMDEKFIASEGRMRAEIVASEARTGEKIDRVENNLSAEIKKNRISMTRHMQELNAKWVETNEKLDRMLARMDGMDKNMSADAGRNGQAVPKRFDSGRDKSGQKNFRIGGSYRRYTEKLFFQVAEGKRNVLYVHLGWKDKRSAGDTNIPADLTIRITQVRVYRRPQHGSRI